VNDGYCDCRDGSDEPGTSACPNGRFFCKNAGYKGTTISSSLVDDGICDCCDGSDEEGTGVECEDTCASRATAEKERAEKTLERQHIGEQARGKMKPAALEVKKNLEAQTQMEQGKLKELQTVMQPLHATMQDPSSDHEKKMRAHQQFQHLRQQMQRVHQRYQRSMHLQRLGAQAGDLLALVQDCTSSDVLSEKLVRGGAVTYVEKHYTFTICPFEYVIQYWQRREDWEYQTCLAEVGEDPPDVASPAIADASNTSDAANASNRAPARRSNKKMCVDKARAAVRAVDPNEAAQHAQVCASQPTDEHKQACNAQMQAAHQAAQVEAVRTFLGLYNANLSVPSKYWVYTDPNDQPCSNGQRRQVNVSLVCGHTGSTTLQPFKENPRQQEGETWRSSGHVLQVAENGMCNYEMTLETPAACKPGPGVVGADQGDSNSWSNWFSGFGAKDEM